jgi:DNA-binding transcriptional LysR family regulator
MEWSDLRIFLALLRCGSFEAAARSLGSSAATVARRLRALEQALGQPLMQRGPRGLLPTEDGLALREPAERMEAQALAIERSRADAERALQGSLRVTAPDWFAALVLAPVVVRLAQRQPGITVELLSDTRYLSLVQREAEVAFRIRPFEEADVVSRRLLRTRYGVYQRRGRPAPADDGQGAQLISLERGFVGPPDDSWLAARLPQARVSARANSRLVQAELCALGLGLAVLPLRLGERLATLRRVDLGDAPPPRDTWMGYPRELRRQPRLRAFMAEVQAELTSGEA